MDQADKDAEEMLPCTNGSDLTCNTNSRLCAACVARPAVAAKLRELYAEIERLLGLELQLRDLIKCYTDEGVRERKEIERLKYELAVIGDMAVTDWNGGVVSRLDRVLDGKVSATYAERRRAEFDLIKQLRTDIDRLKQIINSVTIR